MKKCLMMLGFIIISNVSFVYADNSNHGADWLSYISDYKKLSEISMPGTHDTMASKSATGV